MADEKEEKGYADEFFKHETKEISEAEYEKRNQSYVTQQELLRLLNAWYENAVTILENNGYVRKPDDQEVEAIIAKYGYDRTQDIHIPKLGGLFCFKRGATAYDVIKEKEARNAYEVITQASNVYRLLRGKDKCALALAAIALGSEAVRGSLPDFIEFVGSKEQGIRGGGKRGTWGPIKQTLQLIVDHIGSTRLEDVLNAIEEEYELEDVFYPRYGEKPPAIITFVDRENERIRYEETANGKSKSITFSSLNNHLTAFRK